jgi:hypothetical protein
MELVEHMELRVRGGMETVGDVEPRASGDDYRLSIALG